MGRESVGCGARVGVGLCDGGVEWGSTTNGDHSHPATNDKQTAVPQLSSISIKFLPHTKRDT